MIIKVTNVIDVIRDEIEFFEKTLALTSMNIVPEDTMDCIDYVNDECKRRLDQNYGGRETCARRLRDKLINCLTQNNINGLF